MIKNGPFWRQIDFLDPKNIIFWALECLQCTLGNNSHGINHENKFINEFCTLNRPKQVFFFVKMAKNDQFFHFSMWKRRHISKIYYMRIIKMPLKSFYDITLRANVPFWYQKCSFRCSRDVNLCNRRINSPKWPFLTSLWGPPATGETIWFRNFFKSCLATCPCG